MRGGGATGGIVAVGEGGEWLWESVSRGYDSGDVVLMASDGPSECEGGGSIRRCSLASRAPISTVSSLNGMDVQRQWIGVGAVEACRSRCRQR